MKNKLFNGIAIMVFGNIIGVAETIHFGNNLFPSSPAETIWDLLSLMIILTGVYLIATSEEYYNHFKR